VRVVCTITRLWLNCLRYFFRAKSRLFHACLEIKGKVSYQTAPLNQRLPIMSSQGLNASGSGLQETFGGFRTETFPQRVKTVGDGVTLG
jgi:hypothetical protein